MNKPEITPGDKARQLIRTAAMASLGTIMDESGYPFVSLVTLGSDTYGAPLMLLSRLAWHSRNIHADPRVSLLIEAPAGPGDPLAGARVTLWGRVEAIRDEQSRRRYLARQPHAEGYIGFEDFSLYRMTMEGGHSVAGFGRIVTLEPEAILLDPARYSAVAEAEAGIVEHMNEDHSDAVALYATHLLGAPERDWRMAACDPDGCDLTDGEAVLRLDFPEPAHTSGAVRDYLVAFARQARGMADG